MATKPRSRKRCASTPALSAPAPESSVRASKVIPRGLDLTFNFRYDSDSRGQEQHIKVRVIVCTAAEWAENPASVYAADSWSKVLLGDGWVAACQLLPRWGDDGRRLSDFGDEEFDPDYLPVLRRFRDSLIGWIDAQDWLGHTVVMFNGNGGVTFDATVVEDGNGNRNGGPMVTMKINRNDTV
jgi:hypothetical protein